MDRTDEIRAGKRAREMMMGADVTLPKSQIMLANQTVVFYVMGDVAIPIGFEDANFTGALMPDGSPVKQSMGNTCGWEYGGGGIRCVR